MAYVPGSHRVGILPHRLYGGAQESNSIECCEGFDERTAVVCPVPAGAMIIHHCRTVHGASANKTNDERLAYALSFSTPLKLRKKFREFPWLKNLRKPLINRRTQSMQRGGLLSELVRVARSELLIQKVFRNFFLRRVNQLRGLFRRS
jgi:Phytanoyl-CoA dioxygenase (PhyH)